MTRAEQKANQMADLARAGGLEVEVKVEHREAQHSDDGSIMLPAATTAWVTMTETNIPIFRSMLSAGWSTYEGAGEGRRTSTRFLGGHYYPGVGKSRKLRRPRDVEIWVSVLGR